MVIDIAAVLNLPMEKFEVSGSHSVPDLEFLLLSFILSGDALYFCLIDGSIVSIA